MSRQHVNDNVVPRDKDSSLGASAPRKRAADCRLDDLDHSADVVLGTTASKSHAALGVSVVRSHGRKGTDPPLKASDLPGPSVKTERPSGPLRQNETPSISPSKLRPSQGPYYPPLSRARGPKTINYSPLCE